MKNFNDYLLPDPGKIFKQDNTLTFKVSPDSEYQELTINTDNIKIVGKYAFVDNCLAVKIVSRKEMKIKLISNLFSMDDQIAIILNEDTEMIDFMNSWRSYFSDLITKITEI